MASTITKFSHLQIPLEDVLEATDNFNDKNVIGQGGLGKVYKGKLLRSGKWVNIAARRLDSKHKRGIEFWTEISVLSSLKHENIVSIIGFCDEKGEKVIINKHEAKGSLVMYLSKPTLTWVQILKICVGIARALSYAHYEDGRSYSVVHRNINSSTILLDANFEPKLSGFEYSINRSVHLVDQVLFSEAIGTIGYMDPSIEKSGGVTHKSDIYSFGCVLCEVLCGRKAFIPNADNRFLAPLAIYHFENNTVEDIIQPRLMYQMSRNSVAKFLEIAYSCLNDDRLLRPDINDLVHELEEALELQLQYESLFTNNLEQLKFRQGDLKIRLADIKLATDNFSEAYRMWDTSFYDLYRAELELFDNENFASVEEKSKSELPKRRATVVIKRIRPRVDKQGEKEFVTEIEILTSCKHGNIVRLLGFCDEGFEKILVFEHLSNGYLEDYLVNIKDKPVLTWAERLKICLDVAYGLNYLHYEMEDQKTVINCNIRSSRIALDENWRAKITDFGLSKFLPNLYDDSLRHFCFAGAVYYLDPEYENTFKLDRESDVYSFGVVLFEILTGRVASDPIYTKGSDKGLKFVARRRYQDGTLNDMIDPLIMDEGSFHNFILTKGPNKDSLHIFVNIAYQCLAELQHQRPTMKVIIKELEKALLFQEQVQGQDINQMTNENLTNNLEHLKFRLGDLKIRLADIKLATNNFSEAYRKQDTTFYEVYLAELELFDKENFASVEEKSKSELPKRRATVLIKRIRPREDKRGEKVFFTEIEILTSCKHDNIVRLLGFCDEGFEKILIIEHLSNGYLEDYLANIKDKHVLTWVERLKICLDVAYGLNYLHYEMEDQKTVINCNIKSSIIALDENWRAKIVDFGHSLFLPMNQDDDSLHLILAAGTPGYKDPEYHETYNLKRESDVYSFGVVLFEVLCGRVAKDPIYMKESKKGLAFVVKRRFDEGTLKEMIDPLIKEESNDNNFILTKGTNKDSLEIFVNIAYQCLTETQDQRPTMEVIIMELEKALFFQYNNQVVYEFEKSLELTMTNENFEESGNAVESRLWNNRKENNKEGDLGISFEDIELATQNFNDDNCIGGGGFGKVHKGEVPEGDGFNTIVAKQSDTRNGEGEIEFRNMASTITKFSHLQIPLEDALEATDNFNDKNVIGQGGLGKVYKGKLLRSGKWVNIAARRLDSKHKRGIEFWTEISVLSSLKHENIVSIIGFCDEKGEKVIINKHEAKGSLVMYLSKPTLTWVQILKICVGVARALSYTHYEDGRSYSVVHRNINSSTILLDANFEPKLSGFEYSINRSVHLVDQVFFSEAIGTTGYMDPSIEKSGGVTHKSDIYSFGIVLWEVLCGRKAFIPNEENSFLAPLAVYHFENNTVKDIIKRGLKYQMCRKSVEKFLEIAYSCLNDERVLRPDMNSVVRELEEALELQLPYESLFTNNLEHLKFQLGDLKIRLADIKLATNNFSEAYRKRDTTYYEVYLAELELFDKKIFAAVEEKSKSELPKSVLIKRIRPREDKRGEKVFFTEIEILTSCKHDNIVRLLGFCDEGFEKILVIEHLSNGYLDDYLVNIKSKSIPTWAKRLKICLNVAYGLNYLHYEMEDQKTVINRNIKSRIIALDENWRAKIVDFGHSLFLPMNQDDDALDLMLDAGTPVYKDPEYHETYKLKRKSDVYSFGVVLFEVLCGRKASDPIYMKESKKGLAFVAQRRFHEGTLNEMIDPVIMEDSGENTFTLNRGPNKNSLDAFLKIAFECLEETQDQRPTMMVVVKELEKALLFQENNKDGDLTISLEEIKLATQNFHDDNCVGGGGFGKVYKGKLPQGDDTIVAKRLDTRGGQGEIQFRNELQILFEYMHDNIISLVGYCDEKDAKIIVYEYASRGSLDRYLNDTRLTWMKRLNICIDVATALDFLHRGVGTQATVIHRDIKTANILLNDDWNAKLADFGLSLISAIHEGTDYVIDHACGTPGYVDPLFLNSGFLTKESDIYSFGVVLFEILCGRSTFVIHKQEGVLLPSFVKHNFEKGKQEEVMFEKIKAQIMPEALTTFQTIAYKCLHDNREERPKAKEVVKQLKKALKFQMLRGD